MFLRSIDRWAYLYMLCCPIPKPRDGQPITITQQSILEVQLISLYPTYIHYPPYSVYATTYLIFRGPHTGDELAEQRVEWTLASPGQLPRHHQYHLSSTAMKWHHKRSCLFPSNSSNVPEEILPAFPLRKWNGFQIDMFLLSLLWPQNKHLTIQHGGKMMAGLNYQVLAVFYGVLNTHSTSFGGQ